MSRLHRKEKNKGKMKEELRQYLKRKFTKGSLGEMEECEKMRGTEPEDIDRAMEKIREKQDKIRCPKYIIFDFETDTSSGIHKCNHVEVDVLQVDSKQTHDYENCLKESFGLNGYGYEEKFCDWLFTMENTGSTVIAHNGAGYDNKFVLS
jgi:hypothetical protein